MTAEPSPRLVTHGWTVFAHPLFLDQLESLMRQVESLKQKNPTTYLQKNATKRLAAITRLAFDIIPQDPGKPEYRQGEDHKHWFRAKLFQQHRLFFRYHGPSKVIVLAWVKDEGSDDTYPAAVAETGAPNSGKRRTRSYNKA